ncbi:MAG: hypothetical protein KAS32_20530 [Candidatus Peribacteraceae bacterium]|nr:hypothetical protein [Candidatus Peribacteraceae bacterium]
MKKFTLILLALTVLGSTANASYSSIEKKSMAYVTIIGLIQAQWVIKDVIPLDDSPSGYLKIIYDEK